MTFYSALPSGHRPADGIQRLQRRETVDGGGLVGQVEIALIFRVRPGVKAPVGQPVHRRPEIPEGDIIFHRQAGVACIDPVVQLTVVGLGGQDGHHPGRDELVQDHAHVILVAVLIVCAHVEDDKRGLVNAQLAGNGRFVGGAGVLVLVPGCPQQRAPRWCPPARWELIRLNEPLNQTTVSSSGMFRVLMAAGSLS